MYKDEIIEHILKYVIEKEEGLEMDDLYKKTGLTTLGALYLSTLIQTAKTELYYYLIKKS